MKNPAAITTTAFLYTDATNI